MTTTKKANSNGSAKPKKVTPKTIAKREPTASTTTAIHELLAKSPTLTLDAVLAELKKRGLPEAPAQTRNSFRAFTTAYQALQSAGRIK